MKRKIIEFLLVFICFIFQCTFFKTISLGGIVPNLMIVLTAAFGFMKGSSEGMFVGVIAGLFTDILYGNGIIGLFTLLYSCIGYGNGLFHRMIYKEDVKFPLMLVALSDFFYCFANYVLFFLLRAKLDLVYYFLHIMLPEMIYTVFITIMFYRLLLSLETVLESDEQA